VNLENHCGPVGEKRQPSGGIGQGVIDLHCHILPQIDDGSPGLPDSLEMARIAISDGISITACTPHILPGVYDNTGPAIRKAVAWLQGELERADIPLLLVSGADAHVAPNLQAALGSGGVPTLGQSRYFLLEPPTILVPPRFEDYLFDLVIAGYVPIITHPERLHWVESHYEMLRRLVRSGVWMQLTAGSILGKFGRRARYWSERMLDDGLAQILASDAHNADRRPPRLSDAFEALEKRVGSEEARNLVILRPAGILKDKSPVDIASAISHGASENLVG
jgi:protein-tyrosine phosphatase